MAEYIKREYAVDAAVDVYYNTPDINLKCSECKVEEPLTSNYCPSCGAKMDGGADT